MDTEERGVLEPNEMEAKIKDLHREFLCNLDGGIDPMAEDARHGDAAGCNRTRKGSPACCRPAPSLLTFRGR